MKQNNFSYAIREVALVVVFYLVFINVVFFLRLESIIIQIVLAIALTFIARFLLYLYEKD